MVRVLARAVSIISLMVLAACASVSPPSSSYEITAEVRPQQVSLGKMGDGPERLVGAIIWPNGSASEFVENEVIITPSNENELQSFLDRFGGVVASSAEIEQVEGVEARPVLPEFSNPPLLVRIDPARVSFSDLENWTSEHADPFPFRFSSQAAAKTLAAVVANRDLRISLNFVLQDDSTAEHPLDEAGTAFLDTSNSDDFWHLTDPNLGIDVVKAWDYLRYHCLPLCEDGLFFPSVVAVIDRGFNLDPATGVPLAAGGPDYQFVGSIPFQADIADHDGTAGGISNKASSPWHGQMVVGVCCAKPNNKYGGAGTGGEVVRPMLIKHEGSMYERADGIRSAVLNGAHVINLSSGWTCSINTAAGDAEFCWPAEVFSEGRLDPADALKFAIRFANSYGVTVVASAGNDKDNISGVDYIPCTIELVICVGSMERDRRAAETSNFGSRVHIWAPHRILSAVTPEQAAIDDDGVGIDEVARFSGTSAAAPYVAGVVGLMKALDRKYANGALGCSAACTHAQVDALISSTANTSSVDPKIVLRGYIDPLAAVLKTHPNIAPTMEVLSPAAASERSWNGVTFSAAVADTEPGSELPEFKDDYRLQVISDRAGLLCTGRLEGVFVDPVPLETISCRAEFADLGTHRITMRFIDPFDGIATAEFPLEIANGTPTVEILSPTPSTIINSSQQIAVVADIADPDEVVNDVSWAVDGATVDIGGEGGSISLAAGSHTISVFVRDAFGETATDEVTFNVEPGEGAPVIEIIQPEQTFFNPGVIIAFAAEVNDQEDGALSGSSIVWVSDIDGQIGTGTFFEANLSGPETPCEIESLLHQITVTATDSDGRQTSEVTTLRIGTFC